MVWCGALTTQIKPECTADQPLRPTDAYAQGDQMYKHESRVMCAVGFDALSRLPHPHLLPLSSVPAA